MILPLLSVSPLCEEIISITFFPKTYVEWLRGVKSFLGRLRDFPRSPVVEFHTSNVGVQIQSQVGRTKIPHAVHPSPKMKNNNSVGGNY